MTGPIPEVATAQIGDLVVHRIIELVAPFMPALEMLPALTPELLDENRSWLGSALDDQDRFVLTYKAFVVRTPHHTVLVDTCLGNDKDRDRPEWHRRSDGGYLRALADVGVGVDDVDYVLCTHFHGDHVGWNTRLVEGVWRPTFPRARYVFSRAEVEATIASDQESPLPAFRDSVLPILEDDRADLVDDGFQIADHVRVLGTVGHTAGHAAFCFGKGQDAVVFSGDLLHVPLQLRYPWLSFVRDRNPTEAAATRRAFLERYADTETVCCTGHISTPEFGSVRSWGDGFRLVSV